MTLTEVGWLLVAVAVGLLLIAGLSIYYLLKEKSPKID